MYTSYITLYHNLLQNVITLITFWVWGWVLKSFWFSSSNMPGEPSPLLPPVRDCPSLDRTCHLQSQGGRDWYWRFLSNVSSGDFVSQHCEPLSSSAFLLMKLHVKRGLQRTGSSRKNVNPNNSVTQHSSHDCEPTSYSLRRVPCCEGCPASLCRLLLQQPGLFPAASWRTSNIRETCSLPPEHH